MAGVKILANGIVCSEYLKFKYLMQTTLHDNHVIGFSASFICG